MEHCPIATKRYAEVHICNAVDVTFEAISQQARAEYLVGSHRFQKIKEDDCDVGVIPMHQQGEKQKQMHGLLARQGRSE